KGHERWLFVSASVRQVHPLFGERWPRRGCATRGEQRRSQPHQASRESPCPGARPLLGAAAPNRSPEAHLKKCTSHLLLLPCGNGPSRAKLASSDADCANLSSFGDGCPTPAAHAMTGRDMAMLETQPNRPAPASRENQKHLCRIRD